MPKSKWTTNAKKISVQRSIPPAYAINAVSLCTPYTPSRVEQDGVPTSLRASLTLCGVSYSDANDDVPSHLLYVSAMYASSLKEEDYRAVYPPTEKMSHPMVSVPMEDLVACTNDDDHPQHGVVAIPFGVLGSKVTHDDGDSFLLAPSVVLWNIWTGGIDDGNHRGTLTGGFVDNGRADDEDRERIENMKKAVSNVRTSNFKYLMTSVEAWIIENNATTQALMDDEFPSWMDERSLDKHIEDSEEENDTESLKRLTALKKHPSMLVTLSETTGLDEVPGLLLYNRHQDSATFGLLQSWRGQLFMTLPNPRFADGINKEVLFSLERKNRGWNQHWNEHNSFGVSEEDAAKFITYFNEAIKNNNESGLHPIDDYPDLIPPQKIAALNMLRVFPVSISTVMIAGLTATPVGVSAITDQPHHVINVVTGIPIQVGDDDEGGISTMDAIRNAIKHTQSRTGLSDDEVDRAVRGFMGKLDDDDEEDEDAAPPEPRHTTDFDVNEVDDDDFKAIWG